MSDIRNKNAPLFTLSIAMYLVATAAAEAAPTSPSVSPSGQIAATPDEVVRNMALRQIGSVVTSPGVSLFQPNGNVVMPKTFPTSPSNAVVPQQGAKAINNYSNYSASAALSKGSVVKNPLDIVVADIRSIPATPLALSKPQYPNTQSPQSIQNPALVPSTPVTQPPLGTQVQPLATQFSSEKITEEKAGVSLPTTFISKTNAPNRTLLNDLSKLDVGTFSRKLVAKSQSLMLSIRNDSSALLSFGSTRLEIPPTLSPRLTLSISNNARLPEQLNLDLANLTQQPNTNKVSALGLLLTDRTINGRSSFLLSLISTYRFSNKPNV